MGPQAGDADVSTTIGNPLRESGAQRSRGQVALERNRGKGRVRFATALDEASDPEQPRFAHDSRPGPLVAAPRAASGGESDVPGDGEPVGEAVRKAVEDAKAQQETELDQYLRFRGDGVGGSGVAVSIRLLQLSDQVPVAVLRYRPEHIFERRSLFLSACGSLL